MCRHLQDLTFTHFIVVTTEGTIFGCARENETGHVYNFILHRDSVRTQTGGQWHDLDSDLAQIVRQRAEAAYTVVPTYRTNRLILEEV
jgi:hypothetical protein